MQIIDKFYSREIINNKRQFNVDFMKTIAIFAMIICHTVTTSCYYGYESPEWPFIFAEDILGTFVFVAHAFMLFMGFGLIHSKHNTPKEIFFKGLKLFIIAYVLNFFRFAIYFLFETTSPDHWDNFAYYLIMNDILQFAGIALMLTALFKKLKLNNFYILIIGIILSIIGSFLHYSSNNVAIDTIIGLFFYSTEDTAYFPLFNWYFMVALGMVFADIQIRCKNLDSLYKKIFIISAPIMVVYIVLSCIFGVCFMSMDKNYYVLSFLDALGFLSIDFSFLSIFYFLDKKFNLSRFNFIFKISGDLNAIYCISWIIVGFLGFMFRWSNYKCSYLLAYLLSIPASAVSILIARIYKSLKDKFILIKNNKN